MTKQLSKNRGGFTLVEIMIVVAIIALLAVIAMPGFLRARKRTQATLVLDNLRLIDSSKDQYAIEYNQQNGTPIPQMISLYLKKNIALYNAFNSGSTIDPKMSGITYILNDYSTPPIASGASSAFSDVVDSSFWSPFSAN